MQKFGSDTLSHFHRRREPAHAPEFISGMRFPYGAFRFKAKIGKEVHFEIHSSTDLKNWRTVIDDTAHEDIVEYVDTEANKFSVRFYRMVSGSLHSVNIFGYATITLPPGFCTIANPFAGSAHTVGELFPEMPEGTKFHKFDARSFVLTDNVMKNGRWARPSEPFVPGEGALLFNPTSDYRPLSFVGNVLQGSFSTPIPSGFSLRSSLIPKPGRLFGDLDFPAMEGDVIHIFDREKQDYVLHPYDAEKWAADSPVIGVGESFWVAKTAPCSAPRRER